MLTRRHILAGLGGSFVAADLLLRPRTAIAATAVRITHAITSLAFLQSYVAAEKGYFAEEGLEAELVDTGGGGPDVQLVLSGRAEATVNDGVQVLPAIQQGQDLTCIRSLLNRSIVNVTMSSGTANRLSIDATTPFPEKIRLLKGLRLGATRAGALTWQLARFNLASAGLDPDTDAQVIAIGGPSALAAALENGAIDAIYISMPVGEKLVAEGKAITFIDNARGEDPKLANFMMEGLWVTPSFLDANAELVASIARAYAKASQFVLSATASEVTAVVMPALGSLGEQTLTDAIERMKPAMSADGRVLEAELNATQDVLELNGFLNARIGLERVFDDRFL